MKCPACFNKLIETRTKAIYVDVCQLCKGIWFDSGEFLEVVRMLLEDRALDIKDPAAAPPRKAESVRACPRCESRMDKYNYAYDSNVILDRCPKCQGIWADGGEVRQVVHFLRRIRGEGKNPS